MKIQGQIKAIMPIKETATFRSIEFVVTDNTNQQYPQHLPIQVTQGKCSLLDGFKVGDEVSVEANVLGKEWQDTNTLQTKYFLSLNAWKISKG